MKLTITQLRKIIKEEVTKTMGKPVIDKVMGPEFGNKEVVYYRSSEVDDYFGIEKQEDGSWLVQDTGRIPEDISSLTDDQIDSDLETFNLTKASKRSASDSYEKKRSAMPSMSHDEPPARRMKPMSTDDQYGVGGMFGKRR